MKHLFLLLCIVIIPVAAFAGYSECEIPLNDTVTLSFSGHWYSPEELNYLSISIRGENGEVFRVSSNPQPKGNFRSIFMELNTHNPTKENGLFRLSKDPNQVNYIQSKLPQYSKSTLNPQVKKELVALAEKLENFVLSSKQKELRLELHERFQGLDETLSSKLYELNSAITEISMNIQKAQIIAKDSGVPTPLSDLNALHQKLSLLKSEVAASFPKHGNFHGWVYSLKPTGPTPRFRDLKNTRNRIRDAREEVLSYFDKQIKQSNLSKLAGLKIASERAFEELLESMSLEEDLFQLKVSYQSLIKAYQKKMSQKLKSKLVKLADLNAHEVTDKRVSNILAQK